MKFKWKKILEPRVVVHCEIKEDALILYEKAFKRKYKRRLTPGERVYVKHALKDDMYIRPALCDYCNKADLNPILTVLKFKDIVKKKNKETKHKTEVYHFLIHKEGSGFWTDCVEIEGCQTQAEDMSYLMNNVEEVLLIYLESIGKNCTVTRRRSIREKLIEVYVKLNN